MLIFTHSTMGGGKSSLLISKYRNAEIVSIAMKSAVDTRDTDDSITSRDGSIIEGCYLIGKNGSRENVILMFYEALKVHKETYGVEPKIVFVDEAQFLTTEQVEALLEITLDTDIIIECFGLLTDFQTHLFEGSKRLIELADKIEYLPAYAKDGRVAKQNLRTVDGDNVVMVGGDDIYRAVSNHEYFKGREK